MNRLVKKSNQILYHGTRFDNARKILQSGALLPSGETHNISNNTLQNGAVFLTDDIGIAIEYSELTPNVVHKEDLGVVFCIDISSGDERYMKAGDDVLSPEQKLEILKEMGLVGKDQKFNGIEFEYLCTKYHDELAGYIHSNFSWQESLEAMSEVAYYNNIPMSQVYQMRVYYGGGDYLESEVLDLATLEELGDSILEMLNNE